MLVGEAVFLLAHAEEAFRARTIMQLLQVGTACMMTFPSLTEMLEAEDLLDQFATTHPNHPRDQVQLLSQVRLQPTRRLDQRMQASQEQISAEDAVGTTRMEDRTSQEDGWRRYAEGVFGISRS